MFQCDDVRLGQGMYGSDKIHQISKKFLHALCILIFIYIDDAICIVRKGEECYFKIKTAILIFNLAGFNINYDKSCLVPTQKLLYQGFEIDTTLLRYTAHSDKQLKYINNIQKLLSYTSVTGRMLAEVLGQIQSLRRSHGNIVSILTRSSQHLLGTILIESDGDYDISFSLDAPSKLELEFLCEVLPVFNGKYMLNLSSPMVKEINDIERIMNNVRITSSEIENLLVSDASDSKAYLYFNGEVKTTLDYVFDKDKKKACSTFRELKAMETFLAFLKSNGH